MSTKQDRIANLIVQGMQPSLISRIVGCDPSYISHLLKSEEFKYHVSCLKKEIEAGEPVDLEAGADRKQETLFYADKLAATEHTLLDKVIAEASYMTGKEAVMAIDVIGKRRDAVLNSLNPASKAAQPALIGIQVTGGDGATVNVVQLTIPSICAPELTLAGSSEIIAIGDRSVAPMPTTTLQKILEKEGDEPIEVQYENHASIAAAL